MSAPKSEAPGENDPRWRGWTLAGNRMTPHPEAPEWCVCLNYLKGTPHICERATPEGDAP